MIFVFGLFVGAVIGMIITCCVSVQNIEAYKNANANLLWERNEAIKELREIKEEIDGEGK